MVFNMPVLSLTFFIGIVIWQIVLTILVLRAFGKYNRLTGGDSSRSLLQIVEAMKQSLGRTVAKIEALEGVTAHLTTDGALHVSKIGIIRFNPFADTGGAQSFSMALLDSKKNGIVMTSLYARNGNRWYVKEVTGGKGKEVELSKEESEAIEKAG